MGRLHMTGLPPRDVRGGVSNSERSLRNPPPARGEFAAGNGDPTMLLITQYVIEMERLIVRHLVLKLKHLSCIGNGRTKKNIR